MREVREWGKWGNEGSEGSEGMRLGTSEGMRLGTYIKPCLNDIQNMDSVFVVQNMGYECSGTHSYAHKLMIWLRVRESKGSE